MGRKPVAAKTKTKASHTHTGEESYNPIHLGSLSREKHMPKRRKVTTEIVDKGKSVAVEATKDSTDDKRTQDMEGNSAVTLRFKDQIYHKLYLERFASRDICYGRHVNFAAFVDDGLYCVHQWFFNQGWVNLMKVVKNVYPDLVRQFYTHFDTTNVNDCVIRTWVQNKEIILTDALLSEILNIPYDGVYDFPGKRCSTHTDFDMVECMKLLLGDKYELGRSQKPSMGELNYDVRLLQLILSKSFIARDGNMNSLTFLDIFVMYFVLRGVKVNMPRLMIRYMMNAQLQDKVGLPYGMWLTLVFEHFGIDFSNEHVVRVEQCRNQSGYVIDMRTLTKDMKYYKNDEGKWVKAQSCLRGEGENRSDYRDDEDAIDMPLNPSTKSQLKRTILVNCVLTQDILKHMFTSEEVKSKIKKANDYVDRIMENEANDDKSSSPSDSCGTS